MTDKTSRQTDKEGRRQTERQAHTETDRRTETYKYNKIQKNFIIRNK